MNLHTDNYIEVFNSIDFEKIKDHPNILIAANFWDEERYSAAKTCYKFMRAIDDLIDNHKSLHKTVADNDKAQFIKSVQEWIATIQNNTNTDNIQKELVETLGKFKIPTWLMEDFAKSMMYDIQHDGFTSMQAFLDYAMGASVAPAAVFVHLCGIQKQNGQFISPAFDLKETASPCAIFSYMVHIIRDFQKDQLNNLNYFADDLIAKNGLNRKILSDIANGAPITTGFRNLIQEYYNLADEYRTMTDAMIQKITPYLEPRYQLSLEIIFNLYLMVFERIDIKNGSFITQELNPTPKEVKTRVYETILSFRQI